MVKRQYQNYGLKYIFEKKIYIKYFFFYQYFKEFENMIRESVFQRYFQLQGWKVGFSLERVNFNKSLNVNEIFLEMFLNVESFFLKECDRDIGGIGWLERLCFR